MRLISGEIDFKGIDVVRVELVERHSLNIRCAVNVTKAPDMNSLMVHYHTPL